jgi:hypothetical protein
MNIEIQDDGTVLKDGEKVGTVDDGDVISFTPVLGLHHKTAKSIQARIEEHFANQPQGASEAGETHALPEVGSTPAPATTPSVPAGDPEPAMAADAGDKTPEWIEWFRRNHSKEEFVARYAGRIAELK